MAARKAVTATATIKTTVELPAPLWEAAKMRAVRERTDFRSVVIAALEGYLGASKAKRKRV